MRRTRSQVIQARQSGVPAFDLPSEAPIRAGGLLQPDYVLNAYVESNQLCVVRPGSGGVPAYTTRMQPEYSCAIKATDLGSELRQMLMSSPAVVGLDEDPVWAVIKWRSYEERRIYCSRLAKKGIPTFDGDVSPIVRWMTDNDAKPAQPKLGWVDLETDSRVRFTQKEEARILCWVFVGADGRNFRGLLDADTDEAELRLLEKLWAVIVQYDQVAAWNGDRFDFPMIKARSEKHGIALDWRRVLWLDHLELFRKMNTMAAESGAEKQSMKLGDVCQAVLGFGKDDFDASKTWEAWAKGGSERQRMFKYCMKDTTLMRSLEKKTGFIALLQTLAEACGTFPDSRGVNPSVQVEGFLQRLARDKGHKFPTRGKRKDGEKYKGAFVMDPTTDGLAKNIHVADFASLYPSIILSWNMSPETKVSGDAPANTTSHSPLTNIFFKTDTVGILPTAVSEMIRLRKEWSTKQKNLAPNTPEWVDAGRRSTAYKIAANSFYGVVGAPMSRFFDREVAESVSQCGVWLIKKTIEAAEARNMTVVYGDTDSIFVEGCTRYEFEEFVAWCDAELYPELLDEVGCKINKISLAYEKQFERLIIVTAKKYCNPPEAPIWMGDLSFKPLGDVQVGDEVVGWENGVKSEGTKRKLAKSTVVAVHRHDAPIVKVTFESGRTIRCTADHRWGNYPPRTYNNCPYVTAKPGRKLSFVIDDPGPLPRSLIRQAAYIGALFDGEGCMNGHTRSQITIAQSPTHNPEVCARIESYLKALGFDYGVHDNGGCNIYAIRGGHGERLRFLRWCTPAKSHRIEPSIWISKFGKSDTVVSVEPDGQGDVIGMTTTTGNYVAWGFGSKNCGKLLHYKGTDAAADSKPEIKGLEYKRGDSVRMARGMMEEAIGMLVGSEPNENVDDYQSMIDRWRVKAVNDPIELADVMISKRLNKPLKDYVQKVKLDGTMGKQLPHIEIARKLEKKGQDVGEGVKIDYVIIDSSASPQTGVHAPTWDGTINREAFWVKQVFKPTLRLLKAAFPGHPWPGATLTRKNSKRAQKTLPRPRKRRISPAHARLAWGDEV